MDNNIIKIGFTSKIVPIKPINSQFTLCKCYIQALGKNQNKTKFSQEAVDDALPTLYNIPVVGHIFVDNDGVTRMGGHDMTVTQDKDGKYVFKVITVPYGVVPQQDNVHYEDVTEKNGTVNTYCVADIILWTGRYPELLEAKYNEEIYFAQSMEIFPLKSTKEDGYLNVEKFEYSALCLLGKSDDSSKNVSPCFESARVEPYDFEAQGELQKLFGEFKEELAKAYSKQNNEKGGEKTLDTEVIKKILFEFGLTDETSLSFEISDDMTEEAFREKLQETYGNHAEQNEDPVPSEPEDGADDNQNSNQDEATNYSADNVVPNSDNSPAPAASEEPKLFAVELSYKEKRDKILNSLCSLCSWTETEYIDYYLNDFDNNYVYCHLTSCGQNIEPVEKNIRIPYSIVEDKVEFDTSKTEDVRQVWLTKSEEEALDAQKAEFAELQDYKAKRIEEDKQKAYADVLANFSDLSEADEYKEIVKNAMTFESVDALTEKLYAIRGRYAVAPAKKPVGSMRVPVGFAAKNNQSSEMADFINKYSQKN